MCGTVGIEGVRKLRAVGAKPVAQQFLQFPVEAHDPLADLFLIGGAIDCGIDREATPGSLNARAERDKTRQPAFDRVTCRRSFLEDALGIRDKTFVIAVQNFQEQCILVAEGRIEARLGEAGGGGDVVERSALETFSPEHVAREVQRLVGIETARSCHRTYVRADCEIAKGGIEGRPARCRTSYDRKTLYKRSAAQMVLTDRRAKSLRPFAKVRFEVIRNMFVI